MEDRCINNQYFILISGPPGSGKTSLGKKLGMDLELPFFSKDDFKESLFDTIGWDDREWSQKIGLASINILYMVLEQNLLKKNPIIVESAFMPIYDKSKIQILQAKFKVSIIEIHCFAGQEVLIKRFVERSKEGNRHKGHGDLNDELLLELKKRIENNFYGPLEISNYLIRVNTTSFGNISNEKINNDVKTIIKYL